MEDVKLLEKVLEIIKKETIPALGCTEPVAVALAASMANRYLKNKLDSMSINVSKNIYKNGKSVIIPGTKEWGLELAGILGFIAGNPDDRLMVLRDIKKQHIEKAHNLLKEGKVDVNYLEDTPDVYVEVVAIGGDEVVKITLEGAHDHISRIEVDNSLIFEDYPDKDDKLTSDFIKELTFSDMVKLAETVPIESIKFIEDGINMNKSAANVGIGMENGLNIGKGLLELERQGKLKIDTPTKSRILTAAAADLRMGGGNHPIMTSSGSGNQGIGVILPIVTVAEDNCISENRLKRAIFLAHIINKYVKLHTGKLSALCGCAIGAGVGASSAISWMLGGNKEQIEGAPSNMLANLTGMVCDGAKDTCAFKLSTSAEEAVIAAYLANEGIIVNPNNGIIGDTIEGTIKNLEILCKKGFSNTDSAIIDIISTPEI